MKDHRTTAELVEIVGAARSRYPRPLVDRAEAELRARTADEQQLFEQKAGKIGRLCAWLGALFLVWGIAGVPIGFVGLSNSGPTDPRSPLMFRHFQSIFIGVAALEAVAGGLLLGGGLKFKARQEGGRRMILAALWLAVAYGVSFTLGEVPTVFQLFHGSFGLAAGLVGVAIVTGVAWCLVLWLPLRYFNSPRVREFCRHGVA